MKLRAIAAACLGLFAFAPLGCGATFDPPTEITTLRILGVSKDKPYAVPGDSVTLTMLWNDGSKAGNPDPTDMTAEPRKLHIVWLGGCFNPPGDAYSGCYPQFAEELANGYIPTTDVPTFTLDIPTEYNGSPILHPSQDPKLPRYGLSYVFYAICAGNIAPGDVNFPIHCKDADGHDLGPDDFIVGYSAIYFFEPKPDGTPYLNANPVANGLRFGGAALVSSSICSDPRSDPPPAWSDASCLGSCEGDGCINPPPVAAPTCADGEEDSVRCMPACPDDGDPQKCPEHHIQLDISPPFEKDEVTNFAYGNDYSEQMWIDYYSTAGRFKASTKLLNDATTGFNADNGTEFYAPKTAGPVRVWAVMHDNRGGVSWAGTTLTIQ